MRTVLGLFLRERFSIITRMLLELLEERFEDI